MNSKSSQRSHRVTMKDVAIESGVSQSTVSFVLNGLDNMRISDETRHKVIKAANKLGYRRRAVGRPPVNSGHEVIGVMFDEVATSPFAAISIEGIQEEAWKNNILVEIVMTGGDKAYEKAILRKWSNDQVLGVVYGSIWCGRERNYWCGDSNFHSFYRTATSTLRVYQFRHDRTHTRLSKIIRIVKVQTII